MDGSPFCPWCWGHRAALTIFCCLSCLRGKGQPEVMGEPTSCEVVVFHVGIGMDIELFHGHQAVHAAKRRLRTMMFHEYFHTAFSSMWRTEISRLCPYYQ